MTSSRLADSPFWPGPRGGHSIPPLATLLLRSAIGVGSQHLEPQFYVAAFGGKQLAGQVLED